MNEIMTIMHSVSEIDEMLISGLVLIGQSENSIIAILALLETQRQRWWMVDWIGQNMERDYYPETMEVCAGLVIYEDWKRSFCNFNSYLERSSNGSRLKYI